MNVAVLGASDKPERYSYMAVKMLEENGHDVFPVHPRIAEIEGRSVFANLADVADPIDTVTVYVSAGISDKIADVIVGKSPRRVIFNPGAENTALADRLRESNVEVIEACTLVMLRTGQF